MDLKLIKFIVILFIEFHPAQFIITQSIHARPERGHGQIILVDAQSGREAGQIGAKTSRVHGNFQVREAPRTSKETGGGAAERPNDRDGRHPKRCHSVA